MNRVSSLLKILCILLGNSLEPRLNSRVLVTAGSVMTIGLPLNGCLHSKNKFDGRNKIDYDSSCQMSLFRLFVSTSTAMFNSEKIGSSKQIKALFVCKSEAFFVENWFILPLKVPSIFLKKKSRLEKGGLR